MIVEEKNAKANKNDDKISKKDTADSGGYKVYTWTEAAGCGSWNVCRIAISTKKSSMSEPVRTRTHIGLFHLPAPERKQTTEPQDETVAVSNGNMTSRPSKFSPIEAGSQLRRLDQGAFNAISCSGTPSPFDKSISKGIN